MDELTKNYSPSFREFIGIVEVLRDTLNNIDDVYNETAKEMVTIWQRLKN